MSRTPDSASLRRSPWRRIAGAALGACLAASAVVVLSTSSASAATGTLRGAGSNRCLDVPGANQANGTQVALWDCHGSSNQSWTTTSSRQLQVFGSKCLDALGGATAPGTRAVLSNCVTNNSQQWNLNSNGTVTNVKSGLCLDVTGGATGNGALVILWSCTGQPNQRWTHAGGTTPTTPNPTATSTTRPPTAAPTGTPVQRHGQLRVCGARICDRNGASVQLRGVSSMWLNWESTGYAENATALRWMRDNWNLTVIRAAMGVEPSGAYLSDPARARAQVERVINNAVAAGVYVIVDWHAHEAQNHTSQSAAFFGDLARRYGHLPNVLWETYNEPLQVSWTGVLKPYHQTVLRSIRAADPDNIVILGTPTWSQGIDQAAASPVSGTNLMYTVHFYSCSHGAWLRDRADAARRAGLAIFVTEWGASHADGGTDGRVCAPEAQAWLTWMRTNGISWTAWKLSTGTDSTNLLRSGAPVSGGWSNYLHGHASLVVAGMR